MAALAPIPQRRMIATPTSLGHDRDFGAGGVAEAPEQILHGRLRGGVNDRREVVHVPDRLRREELVHPGALRQQHRGRQL